MHTGSSESSAKAVPAGKQPNPEALRIMARSLFRELKENGYDGPEIVSFSSELLGLVAHELGPSPSGSEG
jgi:hypothetical protein